MTQLEDSIDVGAVFTSRGMRPVWFSWQNQRRMIRQITYAWKALDGAQIMRYFTVADDVGLYDLCFNPRSLQWSLTNVRLNDES